MNLRRLLILACTLYILFCLSACATVKLDPPRISLVGYSPFQLSGFEANSKLKLRIVNPNRVALPLDSMDYNIAVNNHHLVDGITNDLPTIPARGEKIVELNLNINLLSAPQFLLEFLKTPGKAINYNFTSTVDLKGALPSFDINETGELLIH